MDMDFGTVLIMDGMETIGDTPIIAITDSIGG